MQRVNALVGSYGLPPSPVAYPSRDPLAWRQAMAERGYADASEGRERRHANRYYVSGYLRAQRERARQRGAA